MEVFGVYSNVIDKSLDASSTAALTVRATVAGDKVTLIADVSALPAGMTDAKLHLVLAERMLLFGGENGIRGHHMVVRGVAGESGQGLPIAKTGTSQFTFDLAQIREGITRSLAADITRRAGQGAPYAAADHAMTTIDVSQLVAVAFIQAPDKKILQATKADVKK